MDGRLVFLPAVVGRIFVRWKCKKCRHHRSHRCTLLPEAMPIGVPSAAHRLAVLPMCQPLICHRALTARRQGSVANRGRSAASVPPACPFPFPVQQPHARISGQPPSWETVFILFCTAVSLLAAPTRPPRSLSVRQSVHTFPSHRRLLPRLPGAEKSGAAPKNPFLCKVLPSRQFHSATPKPSAFIKTFFEKKASKSLPGRKKVIPLQPQTRSNGVIRPALRSEEEVIEKFTYQAASVRIQRKTNRQGLEEKIEE